FASKDLKGDATRMAGSGTDVAIFIERYLFPMIYPSCKTIGPKVMNFPLINVLGLAWGAASGMTDGGNISRYGSMLIGLLSMVVPQLAQLLPPLYNLPLRRAVTFGVSASLSTVVYTGLKEREERLSENVRKLEKVIADFKLTEESGGLQDTGGVEGGGE